MKTNIELNAWNSYLKEFNKRNQSRPTWLQVFGDAGAQSEEQDLPLNGVSLELRDESCPNIQIMLGGHDAIEKRHLTHMIRNVKSITPQVGYDGRDRAIEFVAEDGQSSLLIFRHRARMAAHA